MSGFEVSGFSFVGRLMAFPPGRIPDVDWVPDALVVPCPSCGVPVRVPDIATATGRALLRTLAMAAVHAEPVCARFEGMAGIRDLAAFITEIYESEPEEGPPS